MSENVKSGNGDTCQRMMTITDEEFGKIRTLVYERFGINLTEKKRSLVIGRLQKLVRAHGFAAFDEYYRMIIDDRSGRAMSDLVNRISTNHTFFYRESEHFTFLRTTVLTGIAARLKAEKKRELRIWCAGCSSGEEPYTFVIEMMEHFGSEYRRWDGGVLATDISANALEGARRAIYSEERLARTPAQIRDRYFERLADGRYRVIDEVRKEVTFRRLNLMNETFPFKSQFHLISCRNVMIYFDQPTRQALVRRFHDFTREGGFLFIGHSESLGRTDCPYTFVAPAIYRKD